MPQNLSVQLQEGLQIPEPTRSLLWITDEDPSKRAAPLNFEIRINIRLTDKGVEVDSDEPDNSNSYTLYSEPSLIWSKLPIQPNSKLETSPLYYPSYADLTPEQRYQYLFWLRDITQPTNLSYVFLYYYGLERHLLLGNYDAAVNEIIELVKHHGHDKFIHYVDTPLLAASIIKQRHDILNRASFLLDGVSNEALLVRKQLKKPLQAKDMIKLANRVGFTNRRYIKLYPKLFEEELAKILDTFEKDHGDLLQLIATENIESRECSVFINHSFPPSVRSLEMPWIIDNKAFTEPVKKMLAAAHESVKEIVKNKRRNM